MKGIHMLRIHGFLPMLLVVGLMCGTAGALEINLTAAPVPDPGLAMPDGSNVPAWGYALDVNQPDGTPPGDGVVRAPGPVVTVPPGDNQLVINLTNRLPESTSLHILGQTVSNSTGPVYVGGRVNSFCHETRPNETGQYIWGNFKPGTYLLQSGTNPAKQVQMGLYALVKKDQSVGFAYPGIRYTDELIVVLHEIDPDIHAAIVGGSYTSSIHREPRYYLINGKSYPEISGLIYSASEGDTLLVRFLNAGLETHVPQVLGMYMTAVAEDGNPYDYSLEQCTFEMPAGKTFDVVVGNNAPGTYPLYDARLRLSNRGTYQGSPAGGGMATNIEIRSSP